VSSADAGDIEVHSGDSGSLREEPEMTGRARFPLIAAFAAMIVGVIAATPIAAVLAAMPTAIEYAVML
jgi:hypothetical protein